MIEIYRYLKGFVKVKITGDNAERFINICVSEGVAIWSIIKIGDNIIFCLLARDFRKLLSLKHIFSFKIKIKLIEKNGLVFKIKTCFIRKGIPIGIVIFITINIFLSQFIWCIDVKGNTTISKDQILSECFKLGINIGSNIKDVDTYTAKQQLGMRFKDIAWVSLNIEGTKLTVNISEAVDNKKEIKNPRNIVALCDGIIKRIEITKGMKNIEINQAVKEGDVLVSGIIENTEKIHFLSAEGIIIAETALAFDKTVNKHYNSRLSTDKRSIRRVFEFFWLNIPLYLSDVGFKAETYIENKKLFLFGNELPIGFTQRVFEEIKDTTIEVDEETAKNIALSEVVKELKKFKIENVIDVECSVKENENNFRITVNLKCLQNICEYSDINSVND